MAQKGNCWMKFRLYCFLCGLVHIKVLRLSIVCWQYDYICTSSRVKFLRCWQNTTKSMCICRILCLPVIESPNLKIWADSDDILCFQKYVWKIYFLFLSVHLIVEQGMFSRQYKKWENERNMRRICLSCMCG